MSTVTGRGDSSDSDVARLSSLDDRLAGHRRQGGSPEGAGCSDPPTDRPDPRVRPGHVEVILRLNEAGAEHRRLVDEQAVELPGRLGRFTLLREVGRGGFATVHEAIDTRLHRRVALKVAHSRVDEAPEAARRFVREAELAARVAHPHVVTIHDVGEEGGRAFIAEEFCDGGSLADWLEARPGPVPPGVCAAVVRAIAEGLHTAHGCGVVHRDVKPANVMLATTMSSPVLVDGTRGYDVKLGDFGLGKLAEDAAGDRQHTQLSRDGDRVGTLAWMAPEQIDRSVGPLGPRTDVHALGLLLDRMLTGRFRHAGRSEGETLRLILFGEPQSAERVVPGVPADIAAVCLKCLAREPRDRYASAAEVAVDLSRFLEGRPTIARPLSRTRRAARFVRRQPLLCASLAATLVAAMAGGMLWADRARTLARTERQRAELVRHEATGALRQAFDAWRNGSVQGAIAKLRATRSLDPLLADSLAGRWLLARTHGEQRLLLDVASDRRAADSSVARDIHVIAAGRGDSLLAAGRADGVLSLSCPDGAPGPRWLHVRAHDEINDVAIAPGGDRVATVGQDGAVHVWSAADGTRLATPRTSGEPLYAVAFSPDGSRLAWGGESRAITVVHPMDPDSEATVLTPFATSTDAEEERDGEVEAIVWLDAERLVASCGSRVVSMRVSDGRIEREFGGLSGVVGSLDLSPDGRWLLCAGTQKEPAIFDIDDPAIAVSLPTHPNWVQGAVFSPDGRTLCTGCKDGIIRLFDTASGAMLRTFVGHEGRTWDVRFTAEGSILSAGADGTLRQWDPEKAPEIAGTFETRGFRRIASFLAAGAQPPEPSMNRRTGVGQTEIDPDTAEQAPGPPSLSTSQGGVTPPDVTQIDRSPLDGRIAIVDRSGLYVSDPGHPKSLRRIADRVYTIAWTRDGRLVTGGWHGEMDIFEKSLDRSTSVDPRLSDVDALAIGGPDGDRLAVGADAEIHLFDIAPSRTPSKRSQGALASSGIPGVTVTALAWSPDGRTIAYGTSIGTVQTIDGETGLPRATFSNHVGQIRGLRFSRDGRILVSSDVDGVRISDVGTTAVLDELRSGWSIAAIDLAPDASGTPDAGLWVLGTARPSPSRGAESGRLLWLDLRRQLAD